MAENDVVIFELINYNQSPFAVPVKRILELENAFCDLIHEMTSIKTGKSSKKKRQYSISLSLIEARQASLLIRFKANIQNIHDNRNEIAAYAAILGLPIALLQLSGVGSAVNPQKPDAEFQKVVDTARDQIADRNVEIALRRLERAIESTRSHEVIIVVPSAPTISVEAYDPRPEDGRLNEYIWQIPNETSDSVIDAVSNLYGVINVEKNDSVRRGGGRRTSLTVKIDQNLGTREAHKCIEDIASVIKKSKISHLQ